MNKKTRQVKLQPRNRRLKWSSKIVPELRIGGVWLSAAGFKAGDEVVILISTNELIIKPL